MEVTYTGLRWREAPLHLSLHIPVLAHITCMYSVSQSASLQNSDGPWTQGLDAIIFVSQGLSPD